MPVYFFGFIALNVVESDKNTELQFFNRELLIHIIDVTDKLA